MLAPVFGCGSPVSGSQCLGGAGNHIGCPGGTGLQLPVEHPGAEGAGKAGRAGLVSEKSEEEKKLCTKTMRTILLQSAEIAFFHLKIFRKSLKKMIK